jgi:hypothetical protein
MRLMTMHLCFKERDSGEGEEEAVGGAISRGVEVVHGVVVMEAMRHGGFVEAEEEAAVVVIGHQEEVVETEVHGEAEEVVVTEVPGEAVTEVTGDRGEVEEEAVTEERGVLGEDEEVETEDRGEDVEEEKVAVRGEVEVVVEASEAVAEDLVVEEVVVLEAEVVIGVPSEEEEAVVEASQGLIYLIEVLQLKRERKDCNITLL